MTVANPALGHDTTGRGLDAALPPAADPSVAGRVGPVIEAVLVDVGGVLVMPNHRVVGEVATLHGGRDDPAALVRGHYEGVAAGERPDGFDWASYRVALLRRAGVSEDRVEAAGGELGAALAAPASSVWTTVLPGAAVGLRMLAATGVALGIVSNADGTVAQVLAELGLAQVGAGPGVPVTVIADSAVVGVDKPDPRIFHLALEAIGADPAAAVHVGDTVSADVVGAERAGIVPVHLDPIGWCGGDHRHVGDLSALAELVRSSRTGA